MSQKENPAGVIRFAGYLWPQKASFSPTQGHVRLRGASSLVAAKVAKGYRSDNAFSRLYSRFHIKDEGTSLSPFNLRPLYRKMRILVPRSGVLVFVKR